MRTAAKILALALTLAALPQLASARSAPPGQAADETGAPYFIVKGGKPGVDQMPLKETRAAVSISGTIAHVEVTQVYKNSGDDVLEAIYVFPGSTRSAVFGMRMTVGERVIVAKIQKREEARKMYEAAKAAGKSASLLEQERPNVFTMNVANILPGDTIKVEMDYTELLVPTDGVYELAYPAVVGPRYTGESDSAETWTAQGYTEQGVGASYGWDVSARIDAGMPIKRVTSSSHPIATELVDGGKVANVSLTNKGAAGTKDFVLRYQLAGKAIQTGVLLFEEAGEKFFLAMVQPPEKIAPRQIPKREYVFIMDVSGSMRGYPLDTAKKVMSNLFEGLGDGDLFNILYFSGDSRMLSEKSLPATRANLDSAENAMKSISGGGGTQILHALDKALALPTPDGYARTFVVVTDGYVSVEPQVFEKIRDNLGEASLFAFGIGSSVNRHIIDGMARVGMGEPFYVMHGDDAVEKAAKFSKYIDSPVLTDVKVSFPGFDAYDVEPKAAPDLFASRPIVVFGKYRGKATGQIAIAGTTGDGAWKSALNLADYRPSKDNEALRYLWARHRIAALSDLNNLRKDDARVEEVTQLGLKYNLLTAYTSFVAVDEVVRTQGGKTTTVRQPLPLPDGVENSAVGGAMSGAGRGGGGAGVGTMGYSVRSKVARAPMPSAAPEPAKLEAAEDAPAEPVDRRDADKTKDAGASRLRVVSVNVKGGHDAAVVKRVVRARLATLQRCLAGSGVATGTSMTLTITIGADGKVTDVKGVPASLSACMTAAVRKMTFPSDASGSTVVLVLAAS